MRDGRATHVAVKDGWLGRQLLLTGCLPLLLGVGSWGSRDIAPFVTNPTADGITVSWETVTPSTTLVRYGTAPDQLDREFRDDALVSFHEVILSGLEPDRTYYYKVVSQDEAGAWIVDAPVRTFPTARTRTAPFRFVFLAETHSNYSVRTASQADFAITVNGFDPHLMLNAGDHVDDGASLDQWYQFFLEAQSMIDHIPLMNAWGNHDTSGPSVDQELATLLFDHPGNERYYAFEYGNTLFIALDLMWYYDGRSPEALAWLEDVLAAASDGVEDPLFIVVYFHPPLFGANRYAGSCASSPESSSWARTHLQPLFEQYHVSLVLSGHEMLYARAHANGVTYVQVTSSDRLRTVDCIAPEVQAVTMSPSIAKVSVDCQSMTLDGVILEGVTVGNSWVLTTGQSVFDSVGIAPRPNTTCAEPGIDVDAGAVTGGADAGADGASGEAGAMGDGDGTGCGCASDGGRASAMGQLLLLLLVCGARRRRARTTNSRDTRRRT